MAGVKIEARGLIPLFLNREGPAPVCAPGVVPFRGSGNAKAADARTLVKLAHLAQRPPPRLSLALARHLHSVCTGRGLRAFRALQF